MALEDNSSTKPSGIRPPSKINVAVSTLSELSASETNVRATTAMPPPSSHNGLKHRPESLHEPESKRKTLTDRAGEPYRSNSGVVSSFKQSIRSGLPTSRGALCQSYQNPLSRKSSNTSSRVPSGHSTASKVGLAGVRSQSAMSFSSKQSREGSRSSNDISESVKPFESSGITPSRISQTPQYPFTRFPQNVASGSRVKHTPSNGILSQTDSRTLPSGRNAISGHARRLSSFTSTFSKMSLGILDESVEIPHLNPEESLYQPATPQIQKPNMLPQSHLPKPSPTPRTRFPALFPPQVQVLRPRTKSPSSRAQSPTKESGLFLNKESNIVMPAWTESAVDKKLENIDDFLRSMKTQMDGTTFEKKTMAEIIEMYKAKVNDLESIRNDLNLKVDSLRDQIEETKEELAAVKIIAEEARREHKIEVDDMQRKHRHENEDIRKEHRNEIDQLRRDANSCEESLRKETRDEIDRLLREHRREISELEQQLRRELENEKSQRLSDVRELTLQRDLQLQNVAADIGKKVREADSVRAELREIEANLEREKLLRANIELRLSDAASSTLGLESANRAMKAKIDFLESDNQQQSQAFADLHKRMQEAVEIAAEANTKLRAEESLRRKLHNQVQELKGNIRVFARVRPTLEGEKEEFAKIAFPDGDQDSKEIAIQGPNLKSALGKTKPVSHAFSFDRVFGPSSVNGDIFEEISQLVQSALDGYNVCIFCYGQTGSGKTFTMSNASNADGGMIPRASRQIYETAKSLEEKGWSYKMEGSFVEVYNEELNDLLGKAEDIDKAKHEIRHDTVACKTSITGVRKIELDSPERVQEMLKLAEGNRSVAATKANQRSSRSHSVFILTLEGENRITGERSEGTLNLVDLAGSERLSHSQAEGQRLKETQSINKSLSCLGDVIGALGKGEGGHVPYRNSKLTYLLQYSLGGNSKTLMFVMISPLQAHLNETITSLKFATKVHNTHIGTAKKQTKVSL